MLNKSGSYALSLTGNMSGEGEICGIVVYNTATMEEAKRPAGQVPAVEAGGLVVKALPWGVKKELNYNNLKRLLW